MDHKGEFELFVLKNLGKDVANSIDWSTPRLLCIASDFTKYDEHVVQQINRNIELIRYRRYGSELLLFELVNATTAQDQGEASTTAVSNNGGKHKSVVSYKTAAELLEQSSTDIRDRFEVEILFRISAYQKRCLL